MNSRSRHELTNYLSEIKSKHSAQKKRLAQLDNYASMQLKVKTVGDNRYYYVLNAEKNKLQYLGGDSNEYVRKIQEAHFLRLSTREMQYEIKLIEKVLRLSRNVDYDSINKKLCKTYRDAKVSLNSSGPAIAKEWKVTMENYKKTFPPFRPEELKHKTRDGNYVRSLGEALIYNYLLEMGIFFVYELPLRIRYNNKDSLLLPDFTILSEIDYKTIIYIEHQGMMNEQQYRNKFNETVFKYWTNNYLPERDVFFTFSLPNGGFDDTPISSIISRYVRPSNRP